VAFRIRHLAEPVLFFNQEHGMKTLASTVERIATKPVSPAGHLFEVKQGTVQFASLEHLGNRLGVDASTVLDLIGIPERTRSRRRHEGFLKPDEADRLLRIARVFGEAVRVFGSEEKAALWLKTPSPLFEDRGPINYLDSDAGAHAVSEELVRIDFGDFA
jgi:putative toxin-antitoxin system antitoxin component (TIGR02293 family)